MLLEMRESRHISSSGTVLICWQHSWASFLFILKEDGKGESEQSPLLWTPEELAPKSNISTSLREGAKVLLDRMFCEIFLNRNHSKGQKAEGRNPAPLVLTILWFKGGVQQTNAGCIFFPELPKCSSQRSWLCCDLDIQNKHTGHRGHRSSCTPQVTSPALQEILPFRWSPGLSWSSRAAPDSCTLDHPQLCPAAPCPAREGTATEAEKPQEVKSLLAVKQGEGHLSWLLTFNMQK